MIENQILMSSLRKKEYFDLYHFQLIPYTFKLALSENLQIYNFV